MLIRIGDEMKHARDDHLQKLKTQLTSPFVLKDRSNRDVIAQTLTKVVHCMPHKVNLYSALILLVACEDFDFAHDLVKQINTSLNEVLV